MLSESKRHARNMPSGLIAAVLMTGWAAPSFALDLNRIERWSGDGTNRAALVVDWNDGVQPDALAWGFRWNGAATLADLWQAVTNADHGLTGSWSNTTEGVAATAIEYRRPRRPGDILPETAGHDVLHTAYAHDHTGTVFHAGAWTVWKGAGPTFIPDVMAMTSGVPQAIPLSADDWVALSFDPDGHPRRPGQPAAALHYPFADTVVAYHFGSNAPPISFFDFEPWTDSTSALGRPSVDTTGDDGDIPLALVVPAVPAYPPFRTYEVVTVGTGGYLEVAFDHRVLDHPDNPYGVDFLTFGNSYMVLTGSDPWTNGNPHLAIVSDTCYIEGGRVLVSQDGTNWFLCDAALADDFAPTLGRVYDPSRPATNFGPANLWWGGATDPTLPVDPALAPSNWNGVTLAGISARYRGSAGGTPFDIGALPLATDETTGHKWIRFVRFERTGLIDPEIDAVADVSPLTPYPLWRTATYPWLHDPAIESDGADADADGEANLLEYAQGRDPLNDDSMPSFTISLCPTSSPPVLLVQAPRAAAATDVGVLVEAHDTITASDWTTNGITRSTSGTGTVHTLTARVGTESETGFFRIRATRHE